MRGISRKEVKMDSTNNHVIEFAPFRLAEGVEESALFAASDALQTEFFSQQKGFLRRDLAKTADGNWADVAYWDNMESVHQAMQNAHNNPAALKYFQLMVETEQSKLSSGMMLLSVVKSYS
jgi:hypothetical protein